MNGFDTILASLVVGLMLMAIGWAAANWKSIASRFRKKPVPKFDGPEKGGWFDRQKSVPTARELKAMTDRRDGRDP